MTELAPCPHSLCATSIFLALCAVRRDRRLVDVGLKNVLAEDIFKEGKTPLRWAQMPSLPEGTMLHGSRKLCHVNIDAANTA